LFMLLSLALVGCRAGEAKSTGFTDSSMMQRDPDLPFHKAWAKAGIDFKEKYKKIYIAPVNTDYMLKQTDWQKGERQGDIEKDVQKLGEYTKEKFEKAYREDPKKRFEVLSEPTNDPDTLQLEFALTEVVPSKVFLNALGYAPFGIGMGISAVRM